VPSRFGASPSSDTMYLAGRGLGLWIWLVDAHFSMSVMMEVESLSADGKFSSRSNCGGPVEPMNSP